MVNATDQIGAIASMTGFATREGGVPGLSWNWEVRGVNGRGLDVRLRLPDGLSGLEAPLRKAVARHASRGSISITLRLSRGDDPSVQGIDADALDAALRDLARIRSRAEAQGLAMAPPTPADILALRGIADGPGAVALPPAGVFLEEAETLLASFAAMRLAEGAAIAAVLSQQIDRIAGLTRAAGDAAAARGARQADIFRKNLQTLLDATDIDEARLAQELALLVVKSDVTEEIDRLNAHVAAARDLLASGGPVGRKLDFLMQEFNREANTLCSKSQDTALTAIGLDLKLAIDQTREQVQNVE